MATVILGAASESAAPPKSEPIDEEELQGRRIRRATAIGRWGIGITALVLWEVLTQLKIVDPYFFSSPSRIVVTGYTQWMAGKLGPDIAYTATATIIGFVCGVTGGAFLGLSTWWSRVYGNVLEPYLVTLNAVPKLALAPVLIILFGIGFQSKVALAILMTIVPAAIAAYSGVKSVDRDLETLLFSLGAKPLRVFTTVVVPWTMPWIVSSLRVNIGLALAGAIVGEFIASQMGIGRMILYAGQIMDINLVWVGVTVLSLLAMVMYFCISSLEKFLLKGMLHGARSGNG